MARKYRNYNDENLAKGFLLVIIFIALSLFGLWKTDRNSFWLWIVIGIMLIAIFGIGYILWSDFKSKKKKRLFDAVRQAGAEDIIFNFINSFGFQKKSDKNVWRSGEYSFTWQQLDILRKELYDKGVPISLNNYKDINLLLQYYIYNKEKKFVQESIVHKPNTFNHLTGTDFENLLYRLYTAMGYSAMKTGKTGDQGCDLVVNMGEQRSVVQAKCYNGSVPNAAIQQAVGALKLYNCTKAFVVTNSYFTPEAIQLAKVNNVGLIGGERLREMLMQYLKENWS